MTNQEAIEILREKIFPCVIGDWKEAVGVAISALQAQEAKNSNESSSTHKALDTISRQAVIDTVKNTRKCCDTDNIDDFYDLLIEAFAVLPPAQPLVIHCTDCKDWHERQSILGFAISELPPAQHEIIYCKDCRKHNVSSGYKMDCCALYEWRGMSYGHEHDYQYCCFAERRTDGSD